MLVSPWFKDTTQPITCRKIESSNAKSLIESPITSTHPSVKAPTVVTPRSVNRDGDLGAMLRTRGGRRRWWPSLA